MRGKVVRLVGLFLGVSSWMIWRPAAPLLLPHATPLVWDVLAVFATLTATAALAVALSLADYWREDRRKQFSAHGVVLKHPVHWRTTAPALGETAAGQFAFRPPTPGACVVVQSYPGDVRAAALDEWRAAVRDDPRLGRPAVEPVCRSLAGAPSRGFEYAAGQGRARVCGEVQAAFRDGRTLLLFVHSPADRLAELRTGLDLIRDTLAVEAAAPAPPRRRPWAPGAAAAALALTAGRAG
jgi:hypothetical protein